MRCAVCKDADTYCAEMLRMGIDIPERYDPIVLDNNISLTVYYRDAQWEIGTHYASEDSKYCHAHMCLCPEGRAHSTQIGCVAISSGEHMLHCNLYKQPISHEEV